MKNNQSKVSVAVFAWCLCVCGFQVEVFSQAPGTTAPQETPAATPRATPAPAGGVAIEFSPTAGLGQKGTPSARDQAIAYQSQNKDKFKSSGPDKIWTIIGSASISCPPNSPDFQDCRLKAFKTAVLKAKSDMSKSLQSYVSTQLSQIVNMGNPKKELAAPSSKSEAATLLDKGKKILMYEVDQQLIKRGIDPNKEENALAVAEALKNAGEIIRSERFKSQMKLEALNELSGMQSFRTFESCPKDAPGDIAVLVIHSNKSKQLQSALMGNGPAPTAEAKESIQTWAEGVGNEVLLYTHGAQPRTNENGEVVLVAYGQASPISKTGGSLDEARELAKASAIEELRQFMGELVKVDLMKNDESTITEMKGADVEKFTNSKAYQSEISAIGERLGMSGFEEVLPGGWEATHPSSNQKVCGSVYMWSVSGSKAANKLRDEMVKAGGARGGRGSLDNKDPENTTPVSSPNKPNNTQSSDGKGVPGEAP